MKFPATFRSLGLLLAVACASGAGCPGMMRTQPVALPRVLPPAATREQVIAVVNRNSAAVQSYHTSSATIGMPMMPSVRAEISLERPKNFRLRADTAFTGPEVDLGSNASEFWFWIRRNQPPALFFCRHEQFSQSPARQMIPIEPDWLIEALGVTSFAAEDDHRGPFAAGPGRLEMRSVRQTSTGPVTKVTILDDARGVIMEQHLYDAQGQLVAKALSSDHRLDPVQHVTLPHHVELQLPGAQMDLKIDINEIAVNTLGADSRQLFVRPSYDGWRDVDLGDPQLEMRELTQSRYRITQPPLARQQPPAQAPPAAAARPPRGGFFRRLFQR
ncbi:MAG: hypothetical protein AB7O62_19305 [Pirellulales bacterium]